jgi:3-oxo-4,17-pregnadiene-20-carboxyl-CoA hydratase alpha subunit
VSAFPRPDPQNEDDARFWNALADGELWIQRCTACSTFRHPPRPVCAQCGARESEAVVVAGTGEVWSFTVIHPPTLPAFADRTPYAAVVVRLDEGVFLVSNLVDCPPDEIEIGARVELAITRVETDLALPLFRRS